MTRMLSVTRSWSRKGVTFAGAALVLALAVPAAAQTPSAIDVGTAALITPSAAQSYYGTSTTSTVGLGQPEPAEIEELVRTLRGDIDLIYDYVRNNVEIEWAYGLRKGEMGPLIDQSGTAFDQASLMITLARASGFTATYQSGTITLTGAQFSAWSGITSATAACQLLSSGAIPAIINGSTSTTCTYGSATVSSITLSHAWVGVLIEGTNYLFDPAYKPHSVTPGMDIEAGTGILPGQALAEAVTGMTSGTTSGVGYVRDLDEDGLDATLESYGADLLAYVEMQDPAAGVDEILGDSQINRYETPTGGLRQTSLPYPATVVSTWVGGVPNQYRTTLRMVVRKDVVDEPPGGPTDDVLLIDQTVYVDEVYGRKLVLEPNYPIANYEVISDFTLNLRLTNRSGTGPTIATYHRDYDRANLRSGSVALTVNHPYASAANGGTTTAGDYMDDSVTKGVTMFLPIAIVHGWGVAGDGLAETWGYREDREVPQVPNMDICDVCEQFFYASQGDARREQLAASWLIQASRAADLHARIADARFTHHHSIGVSTADTWTPGVQPVPNSTIYYIPTDSFDRLDVDSGFSLTSVTADALDRRAAVHAIAATWDALEGSVAGQIADLPDMTTTATRFAWGNAPPAAEDFSGGYGPRRFFRYDSGNVAQALGLTVGEGQLTTTSDGRVYAGTEPGFGNPEMQLRRGRVADAISTYAGAGFSIIASEESFLGPGQRGGVWRSLRSNGIYSFSQQRGGALVATRFVGDEPVEIAHLVVGFETSAKGGGSGPQTNNQSQYDPARAADFLRSRFVDQSRAVGVDLQNGGVTYVAPATIVAGAGAFPYQLDAQLIWRGGNVTSGLFGPLIHTQPQTPWTTNWMNMLGISSSGLEAMGQTDGRAATGTIAAFMAQQDVYRSTYSSQREVAGLLIADWWMREISGNVVTVNVGADTRQFVRNVAGQWFAPGSAAYATLSQTGSRTPFMDSCSGASWTSTRGWDTTGMSFIVNNANGDKQTFARWQNKYYVGPSSMCGTARGFRMTQWSFPQQVDVNLTYGSPGVGQLDRLTEVSNTLGRRITFTYDSAGTLSGYGNGLTSSDLRATTLTSTSGAVSAVTDAAGAQTRFTVGGGYQWRLLDVYDADDTTTPSLRYTFNALNRVSEARDAVSLQIGGRNPYEFRIAPGVRAEREDPVGGRYTVLYDLDDRPFRYIDAIGRATHAGYDGRGRLIQYTYPEGDQERLAYDARNRFTWIRQVAKPGTALPDIVVSATWNDTWNKPAALTDARGFRTDLAYVASGPGQGQLLSVMRPAPGGAAPIGTGTRPVYAFTYGPFGQLATTTDPTGLVVSKAYNATSGLLQSSTLDPTGINATTAFTHDAQGDVATTVNPRGYAVSTAHDLMRRPTVTRRHNGAATAALVTADRSTWDLLGRLIRVEDGTAFSGTSVTTWVTRQTTAYTPTGQVQTVTNSLGDVTTNGYDGADRLLQVTDPVGRIARNTYDPAGQLIIETRALGTALQQDYARYSYSPNGQRLSVRDPLNNRSDYVYDRFNRLIALYFPVPAVGADTASATDWEGYGYDTASNRTSLRLRSGETITFAYDNLDRQTVKDLPGGTAADVYTAFDLAGRRLSSRFVSGAGQGVVYAYDAAGRLLSEQTTIGTPRTVSFQYDAASNRIRLTWPDGQYVTYAHDALNRMDVVRESGTTSLADYDYDTLGRRATVTRSNGAVTSFGNDLASRLTGLGQNLPGTDNDQTYGFSYTAASQVSQRTASNDSYAWTPPLVTRAYVRNGLNQYTSVGDAAFTHDARGNLTGDASRTFTYDLENQLTAVSGSAAMILDYDPLGRLRQTVAGSSTVQMLYDDDRLVAEYDGAGSLLRRHVQGPGMDEPIVTYEGSGLSDPRHLLADNQGSVIAASGATTSRHAYGPYGEPDAWTGARFRYTGQAALPEVQLYYYKARVYDPVLGRFLQTDPIGYDDSLNLYGYVANDPVNKTDPTGMFELVISGPERFQRRVEAHIRWIESGPNGAALVQTIRDSPMTVTIEPSTDRQNHTCCASTTEGVMLPARDATVSYNPSQEIGGEDSRGNARRPAAVGLAHELGHAEQIIAGEHPPRVGPTPQSGETPQHEQNSVRRENEVRREHRIREREAYVPN